MKPAETQAVEKPQGEMQTREHDPGAGNLCPAISAAERYDRVAKAAYLRAERRGFLPGYGASATGWLQKPRSIRCVHRPLHEVEDACRVANTNAPERSHDLRGALNRSIRAVDDRADAVLSRAAIERLGT